MKWKAASLRMQNAEQTQSIKLNVLQAKLKIGMPNDFYEQEADRVAEQVMRMPEPKVQRQSNEEEAKETDNIASRILYSQPFTRKISPVQQITGIVQCIVIHRGNILDEGDCAHLACKSKYACVDNENGITCPKGTRNASKTKKYRPLFSCDINCENNMTCSESDNWMAIPKSRFTHSKCNQPLVICANGKSTPAYIRDKSNIEAWEVSRGIQDELKISPYAKFTGSIYEDESDLDFAKDTRCRIAEPLKTNKA